MKKTFIKMAATGAMAGLMTVGVWAGSMAAGRYGNTAAGDHAGSRAGTAACVMNLPAGELDVAEQATLLHMRQEEKLARDVYTTFNEMWNHWAFERIAQSEQRHMETVLALMEKYGMGDPVTGDEAGIFASEEMTGLYEQMVTDGSPSLADALRAGAYIEELDIADLMSALDAADDADLRTVYQNLLKGSRNHLRTFVYQLSVMGEDYTPQHLYEETFQTIVTSPRERGFVDADGNAAGTGRGMGQGRGRGMGTGECPYLQTDDADAADDMSVMQRSETASFLARNGNRRGGHGPGDGTGNGGNGPKDGSGNGKKSGTCINTDAVASGPDLILARGGNGNGGNGNGGNGPGDGTGNGGNGPGDGTGNGNKSGTCINTDAAAAGPDMHLARGGNGNGGHGPGDGTGNGGDGPGDGTGNGPASGDCAAA